MDTPITLTLEAMIDKIRESGQTHCDHLVLSWWQGTSLRTLHTKVPPDQLAKIHYILADAAADIAPKPHGMH